MDTSMHPVPRLPRELGGYRLLELLGRGGMGEVWLAHDLRLDKPCVLKILQPRFARDHRYRRRFFQEAEISTSLGHGRIVPVLDFGETSGHLYLVMSFVDGVDLGAFYRALARGGARLCFVAIAFVIGEVLEALHHAHNRTKGGKSRAVIHRDVTPSNVLISSEGEVFLTDFGIARFEADHRHETYGTLQYMAPEQGRGQACFASDIYGVAGVLHFMLTGRAPRNVADVAELLRSRETGPPSTGRDDVPEPLEQLRAMGLQPSLRQRLASAKEALALLDRWPKLRKATRLLAAHYENYIGPPRSGLTGAMKAAEGAVAARRRTVSLPMAQALQGSGEESARMTVKIARATPPKRSEQPRGSAETQGAHEDDSAGNRWWWRDDEDAQEPAPTRRVSPPRDVEADAPRILRRPHRRPLDPVVDLGSGPKGVW